MSNDIRFVVGLGNPGEKYSNTRHNFGFRAVDKIAEQESLSWKNWNDMASITFYKRNDNNVLMAKPMTFMNNSGFPVVALLKYYKITPQEMLVLYDDYSIPTGEYKFRATGSSGGHNGVNSIITQTRTTSFPRMKLGMGPLPKYAKIVDFVLSNFNSEDSGKINNVLDKIKDIVDTIIDLGFDKAISRIAQNKK